MSRHIVRTGLAALAAAAHLGCFGLFAGEDESAPRITSAPVTEAVEGERYVYAVIATGDPAPRLRATSDGRRLPSFLAFDGRTGELHGTPRSWDLGAHPIEITATNDAGEDIQRFEITVVDAGATPPSITSLPITEAFVDETYTYDVGVGGRPVPVLSVVGTLPGWLSFDAETQRLSGVPGDGHLGLHAVELRASNGEGDDAFQSFSITVVHPPDPEAPVIVSTPIEAALVDDLYRYGVVATGHPRPEITATGPGGDPLPSWLSFDAASGILQGVPRASALGLHEVEIVASNGVGLDAHQYFMIQVVDTPVAPAITTWPPEIVDAGTPYQYVVGVTGLPRPTVTATGEGGGPLPAWLSFDAPSRTLHGTPSEADEGTVRIEIHATNGEEPDAFQPFDLTVRLPDIAPRITSTPPTTALAGETYTYTVTVTGRPAPQFDVYRPSWLTWNAADRTLSGTPGAQHEGLHEVVVYVWNAAGDDEQIFDLEVVAGYAAPEFTSTPVETATVGVPYEYVATVGGYPTPSLSAEGLFGGPLPDWLSFDAGTGRLHGTPSSTGWSDVVLTATNSEGSATQMVSIEVGSGGDGPLVGNPLLENFSGGLPSGWSATGDFQVGTPTATVGAFSGTQVAATGLTTNYSDDSNSSLSTPVLDFTGITDATVLFHHHYRIEGTYDGAHVEVSTDGGSSFSWVPSDYVFPAYTHASISASGLGGWSGNSASGYTQVSVDLESFLGAAPRNQVVFRWRFTSDGSVNDLGWFIDDIRIGSDADVW